MFVFLVSYYYNFLRSMKILILQHSLELEALVTALSYKVDTHYAPKIINTSHTHLCCSLQTVFPDNLEWQDTLEWKNSAIKLIVNKYSSFASPVSILVRGFLLKLFNKDKVTLLFSFPLITDPIHGWFNCTQSPSLYCLFSDPFLT